MFLVAWYEGIQEHEDEQNFELIDGEDAAHCFIQDLLTNHGIDAEDVFLAEIKD